MYKNCPFFFIFLFLGFGMSTFAQQKQKSYLDYIDRYYTLAQKEQAMYKIPSSITLAQGLLESGAGGASLAAKDNNHFGIKCGSDWKGERVIKKDDRPNDCFRKYKKVTDSYRDHSKFLANKSRYSVLFTYKITNYRAWARGLQSCGYATDRGYANKLIGIIEEYQLYEYDAMKKIKKSKSKKKPDVPRYSRQLYIRNDLLFVRADDNDSFDKIAYDMGFKAKDLLKYNEVPVDFPLEKGEIVYLKKKNKTAEKKHTIHIVKTGESMYGISQRYGMRLESLYKLNGKSAEYVPFEGEMLRLR